MMFSTCSVMGLGKLGACMAACVADRGFDVIGVDIDPRAVEALNQGRAPVSEPGLADMIAANRERLRATCDAESAVLGSDITFIVVPTPSDQSGGFSLAYVEQAGRAIGAALRKKASYHLVVLTSTVLPGGTEYVLKEAIESESGRNCGEAFGLCYSPEFIALGSVIHDFLNPDFLLIGESDPQAGSELELFYKRVCLNDARVARTSFVNAELAKIGVNSYVTSKISFANMLAEMCEQLPGGDVDEVTAAIGLDSRIGRSYLRGGLGYGGPCFPRDNVALSHLARELGVTPVLPEATDRFNRGIVGRLVAMVESHLPQGGSVAVLGLAYKPDSNVVDESPGIQLAARLAADGFDVTVFDPLAMENSRLVLDNSVRYAADLEGAAGAAALVVLTNPDPVFKRIESIDFGGNAVAIVDPWRFLSPSVGDAPGVAHLPLGIAAGDESLQERLRHMAEALSSGSHQSNSVS